MKGLYKAPLAQVLEFDLVDVITTSGEDDWKDGIVGAPANDDDNWSEFLGLF